MTRQRTLAFRCVWLALLWLSPCSLLALPAFVELPQAQASKWPDPVTWFTLALAVVGGLQWLTFRAQTAIIRAQSRAHVFIDGFDTLLYTLDESPCESPGTFDRGDGEMVEKALVPTYFAIRPRWKNSGATPTDALWVNVNVNEPGGDLPDNFTYHYNRPRTLLQPLFVGPSAVEYSEPFNVNTAFATKIINYGNLHPGEEPRMFVWGRADYRDVFGYEHFTEWCYRIHFDRPPNQKLRTLFTQWGPHNRTDDASRPGRRWFRRRRI
jgi:hypothetical protein